MSAPAPQAAGSPAPVVAAEAPADVRPLTRAGVVLLLLLAIANAGFLYFWPSQAAAHYAWAIKPAASAAFMGGGYLAGCVATALVVFGARRWRAFHTLAPALIVLSFGLLAATLLHTDRFKFGYPPTWVWIVVYALAPVLVVLLARGQGWRGDVPATADPRLRPLRATSLLLGAPLLVYAIALFCFPSDLGTHWPWPLTPLLAQVVASWLALVGTAMLACAADLRRPSEAFIPYATLGTWCLALLAIPALHAGDLTDKGAPLVIYLGALAALLALAGLGLSIAARSTD